MADAAKKDAANKDAAKKGSSMTQAEALERARAESVTMEDPEFKEFPGLWPYKIGQAYLIFTVSHYWTGVIIGGNDRDLLLADPAWVPDTGRLSDAVANDPTFKELEPVPGPIPINRAAIVSAIPIKYAPQERL